MHRVHAYLPLGTATTDCEIGVLEKNTRSMLTMIEERIRSSDIGVEHRDALIRLRAMIEDDLTAVTKAGARSAQHRRLPRFESARPTRNTLRPSSHKRPPTGRFHP